MLSFKRGLLLAAGILLFSTLSFSQTSTISGTVYDPSGAVIGGVDVTATNEATGVDYKQISNEVGLFSFPSIPVGSYTITVELSGFKVAKRTGITSATALRQQTGIAFRLTTSMRTIR
jgi:hypothetical protein